MTDVLGELRKFVAPEILFGTGALYKAASYIQNIGGRKVLIVSDEGVEAAGWIARLKCSLDDEGIDYTVFTGVSPNPRDYEVLKGVEAYLGNDCSMIVALGGGSPMDCAKGIGIVVSNRDEISQFEGVDKVRLPMPPLICIPTTAGTSADVSQFAIILNSIESYKMAIVSKGLVPDISLIDSETTVTMDSKLTAETGLDALTHAVEAYVSNASSPITDLNALQAVKYIIEYLPLAVADPENIEARSAMMLGSLHAGLAFSNASLGLVHSMAHALGGLLDLPHGLCNAMLLEHVVQYNFEAEPEKYRDIAEIVSGRKLKGESWSDISDLLFESLSQFRSSLDIRGNLDLGENSSAVVSSLAEKTLNDVCIVTNPRVAGKKEIISIYGKIIS